jgi:hypothetical protein
MVKVIPKYPNADDCLKLLDLLCQVIDANRGPETTEREWYAHNLANKFANHCFFTIYLTYNRNQFKLPSKAIELHALPSIDVLARASIEAFLTFHYVFYSPKSDEEKNYKYWAYRLAGHMERKNLPILSPEYREKLDEDNKAVIDFSAKLVANSSFNNLTSSQRNKILRGDWRLLSWKDIALEANLSRMIALHYGHLCGFAHSSSLSVLQMAQAHQKHEQKLLTTPSIYTTNIVIANFINEYCCLFNKCEAVLGDEDKSLTKSWTFLGSSLGDSKLSNPE